MLTRARPTDQASARCRPLGTARPPGRGELPRFGPAHKAAKLMRERAVPTTDTVVPAVGSCPDMAVQYQSSGVFWPRHKAAKMMRERLESTRARASAIGQTRGRPSQSHWPKPAGLDEAEAIAEAGLGRRATLGRLRRQATGDIGDRRPPPERQSARLRLAQIIYSPCFEQRAQLAAGSQCESRGRSRSTAHTALGCKKHTEKTHTKSHFHT